MSATAVAGLFEVGKTLISRIWPDPAQQAEQLFKLNELQQKGDIAELQAFVTMLQGQVEINKIEAGHKSLFVAGWRPAVGWTCAIALALAFIPKALAITALWTTQTIMMLAETPDIMGFVLPPFPDLGLTDLIGILTGMIGIGAMRSFDKAKGVATHSLGSTHK